MGRDVAGRVDEAAELLAGLQTLVYRLVGEGEGEGDTRGARAFSGPNATSIKHLAQSVKDGRLVTFTPVDMDEITGYVAGWDDLRQPCPRVFVLVPPTGKAGTRRMLVPFYNTLVELHDESTAPREEGDPFYETYETIVRPFKTRVLSEYFGTGKGGRNDRRRGGATPMRKAAS